ncbi:hypothetical protein MP228_002878 [Amoeboaphelidium protococcarum]|nr:hypothetical protein MP228_002878 [Amoeboaphelidium protococcarum]
MDELSDEQESQKSPLLEQVESEQVYDAVNTSSQETYSNQLAVDPMTKAQEIDEVEFEQRSLNEELDSLDLVNDELGGQDSQEGIDEEEYVQVLDSNEDLGDEQAGVDSQGKQPQSRNMSSGSLFSPTAVFSPLINKNAVKYVSLVLQFLYPLCLLAVSPLRFDLITTGYLIGFVSFILIQTVPSCDQLRPRLVYAVTVYSALIILGKCIFQIYLAAAPGGYQEVSVDYAMSQLFGFTKIQSVQDGLYQFLPEVSISVISIINIALKRASTSSQPQRPEQMSMMWNTLYVAVSWTVYLVVTLLVLSQQHLLNIVYLVILCAELFIWSIQREMSAVTKVVRFVLFYFIICQSLLFHVTHINVVKDSISLEYRQLLGLQLNQTGVGYTYAILLLILVLFLYFQQWIGSQAQIAKSLWNPLGSETQSLALWQSTHSMSDGLMTRIGHFLAVHNSKLVSLVLYLVAVSFPSYLTLPVLFYGSALLILPQIKFHHWLILIYVQIVFGIIYSYNSLWAAESLQLPEYQDVGLIRFQPSQLYMMALFILVSALTIFVYPWDKLSHGDRLQPTNNSRDSGAQSLPDQKSGLKKKLAAFRQYLSILWSLAVQFAVNYAYLISLIVLYLCGLERVNIINAGFMFFFILFLLYPQLAQRFWLALVVYTELVICLQFFWQFQFAQPNAVSEIWGLEKSNNLWQLLVFHLVILLFTAVQQDVYQSLRQRQMGVSNDSEMALNENSNSVVQNNHSNLMRTNIVLLALNKIYEFMNYFIKSYNILFCCFAYVLIALLNDVTMFSIGYFVLFLLCALAFQMSAFVVVRRSWLLVASYPAALAICCYLYQFKSLQSYLQSRFSPQLLLDIGLEAKSGSQLSEYLFQHVAALFLSVLQYRIFIGIFRAENSLSDLSLSLPDIVTFVVGFCKRFIIVHGPKLIFVLSFYFAIQYISLYGMLTMIYAVFIIPFPQSFGGGRLILMLWVSTFCVANLLYQLEVVQNTSIVNQNIPWIGFYKYTSGSKPIGYLTLPVFLLLSFNLTKLAFVWEQPLREKYPELPLRVSLWPLLPPLSISAPGQIHQSSSQNVLGHKKTLSRIIQVARSTTAEFASGVNYWMSNFFHHFGCELVTLVHYVCGFAKGSGLGLLYILMGIILAQRQKKMSTIWPLYVALVSVVMIFQYLCVLGYPPTTEIQFPWAGLPVNVLNCIGLPLNYQYFYISPDFCVLLFSAFLLNHFVADHNANEDDDFYLWRNYRDMMDADFTVKPRSKVSYLKMVLFRYFIWAVVILLFASGTVAVDLLRFVFLCFSLVFIAIGENFMLHKRTRIRFWKFINGYMVVWVLIQNCYQILANFLGLSSPDSRPWYVVFGVTRFSVQSWADFQSQAFTPINVLTLFTLAAVLIQVRLNKSTSMSHMSKFIKKDSAKSVFRAKEYLKKKQMQILEKKLQTDTEVSLIREEVSQLKGKQSDINDWILLYGQKPDSEHWMLVDRVDGGEIVVKQDYEFDNLTTAGEHLGLSRRKSDIRQDALLKPQQSQGTFGSGTNTQSLDRSTSQVRRRLVGIAEVQSSQPHSVQPQNPADSVQTSVNPRDQVPPKKVSLYRKLMVKLLKKLYRLSYNYTDMYVTTSTRNLMKTDWQHESLLWAFLKGIFFAICAHTTVIVYLAVYGNQVYHGNLLAIIPTFSVLLVAMLQRPYPSRVYWEFLFAVVELTVLIKYFFQFQVFTFNELQCNGSENYLRDIAYFVGIQKSCGSFFVDVITELIVLLCCILHRGLMRRLGLWSNFQYGGADKKVSSQKADDQSQKSPVGYLNEEEKTMLTTDIPKVPLITKGQVGDGLKVKIDDQPTDPQLEHRSSWQSTLTSSLQRFYKTTVQTSELPGHDYYLGMICADILAFILTIIFWPSFSGDVVVDNNIEFLSAVINQNTVPPLFVAILVLNFVLIVTDRAIYIAKSVKAKFLMQYVTVISFAVWIFFILPTSNRASFTSLQSLQLWFFVKCIYWYFSGLQIKSSYPRIRANNFLMRRYGRTNLIAFNVYRVLPFVWEIRNFIDWGLSDTCLDLYQWLKFEEIYASLYVVKTNRVIQGKYDPRRFGEQRNRMAKKICSFFIVLGMTFLIWFPLIFLSIPGSTKPNPATSASMSIGITGYEPFYEQTVPSLLIKNLTNDQIGQLREQYPSLFPSYLSYSTVQLVQFPSNSMSSWQINAPSEASLRSLLINFNQSVQLQTTITVGKGESVGFVQSKNTFFKYLGLSDRFQLLSVMNSSSAVVNLTSIYPMFLHSLSSGALINLASDNGFQADGQMRYIQPANVPGNVTSGNNSTTNASSINAVTVSDDWWELRVNNTKQGTSSAEFEAPQFHILSENIPTFSALSSGSVIGLYVAVVFTVARIVRGAISGLSQKIMYEDLPYPDTVLKMCQDVILAREMRQFDVEESLYYQLITLFRSPRMLLESTRMPLNNQQPTG